MMRRSRLVQKKPLQRRASTLKQSNFKRSTPKKRAGHNKVMRNACRGESCYLRIPGICHGVQDQETVVPAHSNEAAHGKGLGLKARDEFTVPACWRCHHEHDQGHLFTHEQKCVFWRAAYARWLPVRTLKLATIGKSINPVNEAVAA